VRLRERIFPRLLADCPHFALGGCSFKVLRSKETTGRVVVWRQFATPNSFTLEASFCGADFGPGAGGHYSIAHLKEMGAAFIPALLDFTDPSQARVQQIMAELEAQFPACDDDADDNGPDDTDGPNARSGEADASDKLRRAVRGATVSRHRLAVASSSSSTKSGGVCAGGTSASSVAASKAAAASSKKGTASDHKVDAKKKKKSVEGRGSVSHGNASPRNTRSPN